MGATRERPRAAPLLSARTSCAVAVGVNEYGRPTQRGPLVTQVVVTCTSALSFSTSPRRSFGSFRGPIDMTDRGAAPRRRVIGTVRTSSERLPLVAMWTALAAAGVA